MIFICAHVYVIFRCFHEQVVPPVEDLDLFPSDHVIHSPNYHTPHSYRDKVVLVIGNESWGHVIMREVAPIVKEIIMVSEQVYKGDNDLPNNVRHFAHIAKIANDQTVQFSDGTSKRVDYIFLCTGHKYVFPYLHDSYGFNMIGKQGASPLYKLTFNPYYPSMVFLTDSIFAYCDMQIMWALRVWLGKQPLPHTAEMVADCKNATDSQDLEALYKELANYSEIRLPSPSLLGILKQIGTQVEEKLKRYTVLSSEHWIVTNN